MDTELSLWSLAREQPAPGEQRLLLAHGKCSVGVCGKDPVFFIFLDHTEIKFSPVLGKEDFARQLGEEGGIRVNV